MSSRFFLSFSWISAGNYLIIILIMLINSSCEKETSDSSQSYIFMEYSFTGDVQCYDRSGNQPDSLCNIYSQDDFIYSDEFDLPYEKIELMSNNTTLMYYNEEGITQVRDAYITLENDTLKFHSNDLNTSDLIFTGLLEDNQLRLKGYGYIYYIILNNGFMEIKHEIKVVDFGSPNLERFLEDFPNRTLNDQDPVIQNLYIQEFDVIYQRILN